VGSISISKAKRLWLDSYLSEKHLGDLENQCPMIALPSDVARGSEDVQKAYQDLLTAMVWLFETAQPSEDPKRRQHALAMSVTQVPAALLALWCLYSIYISG